MTACCAPGGCSGICEHQATVGCRAARLRRAQLGRRAAEHLSPRRARPPAAGCSAARRCTCCARTLRRPLGRGASVAARPGIGDALVTELINTARANVGHRTAQAATAPGLGWGRQFAATRACLRRTVTGRSRHGSGRHPSAAWAAAANRSATTRHPRAPKPQPPLTPRPPTRGTQATATAHAKPPTPGRTPPLRSRRPPPGPPPGERAVAIPTQAAARSAGRRPPARPTPRAPARNPAGQGRA